MKAVNSLGNRLIALTLSIVLVLGMIPGHVIAQGASGAAQIGDVTYNTLEEALAAVPRGTNQQAPAEATIIKLLSDTACAFDVGKSTGSSTMNLRLDLNGKTLTLAPSVGSSGTKANGIRVLAYSKLEIVNGTVVCSSATEDNVKVGIANYGTLTLTDVTVKKGDLTLYTINNRGALTLKGKTVVESGSAWAITNDPYNLYYTTNVNASVTCDSSDVVVQSMQMERYERSSTNQGGLELNISAGYFGKIVEDGNTAVATSYNVTGGTIGVSTTEELEQAINMTKAGAPYTCPEKPVTIKLLNDMAGSFDVGNSTGKAPKNILLDLNGNTLTLKPGVGSFKTKTSGIRVLAYSKLEIRNGTLICSDEEADNVKVGIANYSELTLEDVKLKAGTLTLYTINNRGALTLKGATSVENGKAAQTDYTDSAEHIAITNDPYNLYYSTPINAQINCESKDVVVGNIQLETYGSKGDIELNITAGSFGGVYQPAANGTVTVKGAISGGSFDTDVSEYCTEKYTAVLVDGKYQAQYVKDDQTDFGFAEPAPGEITFNDNGNKYKNPALNGKGTLVYSIVSQKDVNGADGQIVTIDAATGELTILKAGTVVVKATDSGDALYNAAEVTYMLVIRQDTQEGFGFVEPNPVDKWVGESYTNTATGGQGTGDVTYAITAGSDVADIDPVTGKLTFKKPGTVQVTATKAADDAYAAVTTTYIVKSIKYPQAEFKFENSNAPIVVGFASGSFTNTASGGSGTGKITYAIVSGSEFATINENTGKVTFLKAGEVTIAAKKTADANYNETTATYTLTIEKSQQVELELETPWDQPVYFKPGAQNLIPALKGGSGTGKITYAIIDGAEYATIDPDTGAITTLKAGGFVVKITKAEDGGYYETSYTCSVQYVNHADQTDFGFVTKDPANITFNDNGNKFTNGAVGGQSSGKITYALADVESQAVAIIDPDTGEITILAAGTINVIATKAGDDCYNEITAQYTLTVEKDTPEFTVDDVQLVYGATEYQINVNTVLAGSGRYVYTIEGENTIGARVDKNGKILFENSTGKAGTITVKVKKLEDGQYTQGEKTFTLTVSYHVPSAQPTVSGDKKNSSGWYTGIVTIKAPEGYQISYSNDLAGTTWSDAVTVNTDGDNTKKVYLKKGDEITDAITLSSIKIDTAAPVDVTIKYDTPFLEAVLEAVTFGIYRAKEVTVTLSATDTTSGVDHFTYNIGGEDLVIKRADFTKNENGVAQYVFKLSAQYRNKITAKATDIAGWTSELTESKHTLVIDTVSPELVVKYEFAGSQNLGDIIYSNDSVTVKFEITEANFDLREKDPVFKVGTMVVNLEWTYDAQAKVWKAEQKLSGDNTYDLSLTFADASGNDMVQDNGTVQYTQKIVIDSAPPVISSSYGTAAPVQGNVFNPSRTATFTITESNFHAGNVILTVTAKDITGKTVDISAKDYAAFAQNPDNWKRNGDVYTITLPVFDIDAVYTVDIAYADLAKNEAADYTADEFVIDKAAATNVTITYSTSILDEILNEITFGYYKENVQVTVTADDITSGVDFVTWTYTKQIPSSDKNLPDTTRVISGKDIIYSEDGKTATATFVIDAQARGSISVVVTDKAGNTSQKIDDGRINVVDTIAPTRVVSYKPDRILDAKTMEDVKTFTEEDDVILYYKDSAVVTFTIEEANFYAEDVLIQVDGVTKAPTDWTGNGDVWTGTVTISEEGDHEVTVTYTDRSTNEMVAYRSQKIAIDRTAPTIKVEYDNNTALNTNHYKADRTATITIVDHNFRADDVLAAVTAVDVQGKPVSVTDYAAYLADRNSWTTTGDTRVATITFSADAVYTFDIGYTDIIGNAAEDFAEQKFVVDHAKPEGLKIEYSESVVDKIIKNITFGFYQPELIVTLTAEDATAGVDYFEWVYTKESGASDKNAQSFGATIAAEDIVYTNDGLTAIATFKIPANARGHISATVTDRAGNSDSKTDGDRINVVDNVAPSVTVTYEADDALTLVQFVDKDLNTVGSFDKADIAYYNGDVTAKILINEANFFEGVQAQDGVIHNVGIKLTKTDDDGNVTVYEYLPVGAQQKYAGAEPVYITWTSSGDEHSFSIHYTENADYVLQIEYTDLSSNDADISGNDGTAAAKTYQSKVVTVDKTAPEVSVEYGNKSPIHTINGRDYFDAEQTATITVKEHNFRAADFAATVIAQNILGDDVTVENFKATLSDASRWTKDGNTYTITVHYSVDANYTFDYAYKDLAQNAAVAYDEDLFTVDTTAPEAPTISYSTSVLEKILKTVTFGYYRTGMTVTITAEDETAGIHYFVYSYLKGENVSDVNAELIDDIIADANNRIVRQGKKFTATFTIPKELLRNDNQFNGTVKFTAYDRAENSVDKEDDHRIVVDSIAPTAKITYNKPVQNVNGISYYAGNINATIVINEANFYSEDVVVTVTKDGASYPVKVNWTDNSVDVHTGTFTLTADGDYFVSVEYQDRSGNQMGSYTSNRMTLDTTAPTVNVSNIKNNSANKDEKYGFTITANDLNLDETSFAPVLTATVRKENGTYETKTVSLGSMKTVEAGKTYTFTVDNLEEDAVYSLVCTVQDMSGNGYSKLILSDNEAYDEVRFSVNRNGSTFAVDQDTDALVDQYYVYSVNKDVVIEEINVDPVEIYAVKLNGQTLTEGTDYTTTLENKDGQWSKRTYVISKELFAEEGEYSIVVESTDKANSTAYSDVKNLNVSFTVDRTAPVLTISGLENGGRYQVQEQTVTIIPTDDGGRLYSIKVVAFNADGEPLKDAEGKDISVRFELSGEEFLTYLSENDGKVTFTVPEGLESQVQITCNDCAVDAAGETNAFNETFTKVTVSQSQWIIFYANKPLFYGTIAGVVLLISGIIALILLPKKKKAAKK